MLKISQYEDIKRIDSARTIAGKGFYWTTAYLVDGLLIDTGCPYSSFELSDALKEESVNTIVNTHSHEDHIGANGIFQDQRPEIDIIAHPSALPFLKQPSEYLKPQIYRRFLWGSPEPSTGSPVMDGDLIKTKQYSFQIIYTPGHSPDHICLYEQEHGWLFSGDLFVGGNDRALRVDYDIWEIISSLKKVALLPLSWLFPGSARVRNKPKEALGQKIAYLEEAGDNILKLHSQGRSLKEIALAVFGGPMFIEFFTFGHFTRHNLVKSYLMKIEE